MKKRVAFLDTAYVSIYTMAGAPRWQTFNETGKEVNASRQRLLELARARIDKYAAEHNGELPPMRKYIFVRGDGGAHPCGSVNMDQQIFHGRSREEAVVAYNDFINGHWPALIDGVNRDEAPDIYPTEDVYLVDLVKEIFRYGNDAGFMIELCDHPVVRAVPDLDAATKPARQ